MSQQVARVRRVLPVRAWGAVRLAKKGRQERANLSSGGCHSDLLSKEVAQGWLLLFRCCPAWGYAVLIASRCVPPAEVVDLTRTSNLTPCGVVPRNKPAGGRRLL